MILEFTFLVILLGTILMYSRRKPKGFPPGPLSWPILGNFINVGLEPYKNVMAMKIKYGNIIGIDLGPKRTAFVNDYGLIKEAFNMIPLCGRPFFPHFAINGNSRGILMSSRKTWMEQRRFSFSYMQSEFRNGVPFENLILHEANELIENLRGNCGRPISTSHVFNVSVLNVVWGIVATERYSSTDPHILKIIDNVEAMTSNPGAQGVLLFFFKWAKMFPNISGYNNFMDNYNSFLNHVQNIVDRHKETYQEGIQRDLIDCYLEKIRTTTDKNSTFFGKIGEENLVSSVFDIFVAGSETVSFTLRWLVFLLAHHQEIQEKLCTVIAKHMQERKQPSLKDRQFLPFVEAVVMEVLRFSSIIPVGVFHEAVEDVQFHGYSIPKGTMVVANQYGVHHDPEIWGDPENFRPQRFLNEDETELNRNLPLLAFSTGRRVCPGESLARDELFLCTVKLFQSFNISFDPSVPKPPVKYIIGSALLPIEHKLVFSERGIK